MDGAFLLSSSDTDLRLWPGRSAAEHEAAGARISTSGSEAAALPQGEVFKYLGISFTSEGGTEREPEELSRNARSITFRPSPTVIGFGRKNENADANGRNRFPPKGWPGSTLEVGRGARTSGRWSE